MYLAMLNVQYGGQKSKWRQEQNPLIISISRPKANRHHNFLASTKFYSYVPIGTTIRIYNCYTLNDMISVFQSNEYMRLFIKYE